MTTVFIPIEELDITKRYNIIGVPKCGTSSLGKYLRNKGYDIIETELMWGDIDTAENYNYWDRTPIIVTRNPIERAWSDYNYFGVSLEKACDNSFYKAGLQMWDSLIYSLEYLRTLPDFPHENIGKKTPLSNDNKQKIIMELHL